MTCSEIKDMISFLRAEGAIQLEVDGVKAVFADVRTPSKKVEGLEDDPDAIRVHVPTELEAHIQKRFGVTAEELLGG